MTYCCDVLGERRGRHTPYKNYSFCRVKFGVPLDQVCKRDIPGPLLVRSNALHCIAGLPIPIWLFCRSLIKLLSVIQVMLLKLNKEGPFKKDVFRAPGHQGNMRKLIHFLQQGRLVNIDSFSVNTIASVLKKFLRKIPGGIFGVENEAELFEIIKLDDTHEKLRRVQRCVSGIISCHVQWPTSRSKPIEGICWN